MNNPFDVRLAAISTIIALIIVIILMNLCQGCASIKYGLDRDYVSKLRAPYMVGTQVNGTKLITDRGTIPAIMDVGPSFLMDLGLLPYHLGLYWWHDETTIKEVGYER